MARKDGGGQEALATLDEAIEICSNQPPSHDLGTVLLAKGFVYNEMYQPREAIPLLLKALELLDGKACQLSCDVALHNLIVAVSLDERLDRDTLDRILRRLDKARHSLSKKSRTFRVKLKWAEAIVDLRFGMNMKAKRSLIAIRREFRRSRRPTGEIVMISIDLAQAFLNTGDIDRCASILKQALSDLESMEGLAPTALDSLRDCLLALNERRFEIGLLMAARRSILRPSETVFRAEGCQLQYTSD